MLKNYTLNPFHKPGVSIHRFESFVKTTIERLKRNNNADNYDALISALEALLAELVKAIAAESTEAAARTGKTMSVDDIIDKFIALVSDNEDFIAYKLNKKSPEFKEVFPAGKSEYTKITKTNFEALTTRFATVCNKFENMLGTDLESQAQAIITLFKNTRESQLQNISGVKTQSRSIGLLRELLEKQLHKTLIKLMDIHAENLPAILDYFDAPLLTTHRKHVKTAPPISTEK